MDTWRVLFFIKSESSSTCQHTNAQCAPSLQPVTVHGVTSTRVWILENNGRDRSEADIEIGRKDKAWGLRKYWSRPFSPQAILLTRSDVKITCKCAPQTDLCPLCMRICDRRLTCNPLVNDLTIERHIDQVSLLAIRSRAWRTAQSCFVSAGGLSFVFPPPVVR